MGPCYGPLKVLKRGPLSRVYKEYINSPLLRAHVVKGDGGGGGGGGHPTV